MQILMHILCSAGESSPSVAASSTADSSADPSTPFLSEKEEA
jgi:hypothetical protein